MAYHERRNDIGVKVLAGLVVVVISLLLRLLFSHSYDMALSAKAEACENTRVNAVQTERQTRFQEDLKDLKQGQKEIKTLIIKKI